MTLADILAFTGQHAEYAQQVRAKDRAPIHRATSRVTDREWRQARDSEAAIAALSHLALERHNG